MILAGSAALTGMMACGPKTEPTTPEPGRGWIVSQGGKDIVSQLSGQSVIRSGVPFNLDAPFRIASITKLAVAMALRDLAASSKLDLSAPVNEVLSNTPDGLTLDHLLSHRSGLKDPDVYWADINSNIRSLYDRNSFTHAPGTYFRYANLNTGLAATVAEARTGQRFDRLIWDWLTRNGFDAGLNWSGVSSRRRLRAAALYRKDETGNWATTVDAPADIPAISPIYLGRDKASLENYELGSNGTLFSPQGGMRMSLSDLIKLGEILHQRPDFHRATWAFDGGNGDDEDAHFLAFGPGSYVYSPDISPIKGVPLVGHLGWAYGAHTGMFIVPDTDITLAFARLGAGDDDATMTGERANQFTVHQALFDEVAPILRDLI